MAAGKYDFTGEKAILKGATFRQSIVWKDAAGTPVNLTSRTARMQIRPSVSSETVLIELTTENGGIVLGGVLGTVNLDVSAEQTSALAGKSGVFDLEIVSPDGTVVRLVEGGVEFSPEVTRPTSAAP